MIRRVQFRELDEREVVCSCLAAESVLELPDLALERVDLAAVAVAECEAVASEESIWFVEVLLAYAPEPPAAAGDARLASDELQANAVYLFGVVAMRAFFRGEHRCLRFVYLIETLAEVASA